MARMTRQLTAVELASLPDDGNRRESTLGVAQDYGEIGLRPIGLLDVA